jgi:2',3'-cyclic-nucleotide 2'-phosphodiesterase (5'-nucleotidase family)
MISIRIALLLFSSYAFAAQPSAPSPVAAPLRKLPWGQLNFLHTTDTHGWHGGHLQEAQYSADWGDYISFAEHLGKRADDDGSDLLLIDTGDRVEGNGLYDASDPKGRFTADVIKHQRMDVIVAGNHELYKQNTSVAEYETTVLNFKDGYISSNIEIRHPKTGELVPLAPKYRKFTTKNQGIRVLAFGFIFNFHGNADNTVVQNVQDTIEEQWFQDAIRDKDVDLFLVAGHVPVHASPEYDALYNAIRGAAWDTPIAFFGGHTHIRDYRKWDKKAYGIESGRYMETLGFLSIAGLTKAKTVASPTYQRLYIDNNLFSLYQHSGKNESTFDTELGRNVSKEIASARKDLQLDHAFGCAPHDYWLNRAPYPSKSSLLTWLEEEVIPDTFNGSGQSIVLTNTGAMRFDIFKGPFTIDTTFLVSPFTSGFHVLKDVPYDIASQVLRLLNSGGPLAELFVDLPDLSPHLPVSQVRYDSHEQIHLSDRDLTPGYTTKDDAGTDGDDTIHQEIQFYNVPNCVAANIGFKPDDFRLTAVPDKVDLVYNEFIEGWVLAALKYLGIKYEEDDAKVALDGATFTKIISDWVHHNWKCS